ncbi:MAG: 6-bladed beta-propeller, partial [Deltaproteobacteria bacterium]|nr:6-bladed beta-propeller [Deltaproteobacteria bacterium]
MFGDYIGLNTDGEGNFYITDMDRSRILKYDPAGKFQATIGKKGQGPGEFQAPSVVRFDAKGRLYITDMISRRIMFFEPSGRFLEQIRPPDAFDELIINSKGQYVVNRTQQVESKSYEGYKIVWGIFDDQFNLLSELLSMNREFEAPTERDATSRAKRLAGILSMMAFRPLPVFAVTDNDWIYFGFPEKYVIDVYSPEGQKIQSIRREYNPIKISRKDREYFENGVAARFLRGISGVQAKEVLGFIKYPKFKPAYSRFALMENGWLAVVVEFIENEYTLFDLFDRDGVYIGHFKADIDPDSLFFKNGKAYAVTTKDGYRFAKRYAIEIVDDGQR